MTSASYADRPWRTVPVRMLPAGPAMLGDEERQFLYWLAASQYTGEGAIVDLGTFLGASAGQLAAGLAARTPPSDAVVRSYDRFAWAPFYAPHVEAAGRVDGDDTVPLVRSLLGEHAARVDLRKGDICAARWDEGWIEVLFVDFTQSWDHHDFVCNAFVRHLRPGRSWLVHQDYLYVLCYWLHMWMEAWAEHFEPVARHIEGTTAAFRYVSPLPEEALSVPLTERHTVTELDALLARSIERYRGIARDQVEIARVRFFLHARGKPAAAEQLATLRQRLGRDRRLQPHLATLEHEIEIWPDHGGPYAGRFHE